MIARPYSLTACTVAELDNPMLTYVHGTTWSVGLIVSVSVTSGCCGGGGRPLNGEAVSNSKEAHATGTH